MPNNMFRLVRLHRDTDGLPLLRRAANEIAEHLLTLDNEGWTLLSTLTMNQTSYGVFTKPAAYAESGSRSHRDQSLTEQAIGHALDIVHDYTQGDLKTHRDAWRKCIQSMQSISTRLEHSDNALYYEHELNAFDRVMTLLDPQTSTDMAHALRGAEWDAPAPLVPVHHEPVYRHRKSGGSYRLLGVQLVTPRNLAEGEQSLHDMDTVTVYPEDSGALVAVKGLVTNTPPIYGFHAQLPIAVYKLQTSDVWNRPRVMAFYASLEDGSTWLRAADEFFDGRFVEGYRND